MQAAASLFRPDLMDWLRRYRYWLISLATVIFLLLPYGAKAQAQTGYPPFLDPQLNDYGHVVTASDATTIRNTLQQFKQQTGIQVVVLTVNSVQDYQTGDRTIESFATNLFNTWGIGDRNRDDGILLLVAAADRKLRIELGSGYSSNYDAVAQAIISDYIVPQFREGRISQGTVAGVNAIVSRFNPSASALPAVENPGGGDPLQATDEGASEGTIAIGVGLTGLIVGVPVFASWRRHRKRQCPSCKTQMVRLDEQADDQFLNESQRKEESLSSVDYDAWQCPSCSYHQILPYSNFFSEYSRCPSCATKALEVRTTTTRQPTRSCQGESRIDEHCRHCSYDRTYYRSIPRLTDNSSSSGGSSSGGGGSSSGGGASGSW
ncbi:TPM domain-containing protein [Leptolyngbya sp. FACHB-8]|nr:TPM domain-containing protein [Leptolyngbya sp. FACHB-8]MBD1909131.1 TPM domain-containing protein [Leptolyngbya sp. FACHB-8]MBD2157505.1 TPM domain-containing protein [Leptolyngbya sp. FACHB-16]